MVKPTIAQLMDPRHGRRLLVPFESCSVELIYIPSDFAWLTQTLSNDFPYLFFRVVEMPEASIRDYLSRFLRGTRIVGGEHSYPNDTHANARVWIALENDFLYRTGTA